jgi:outer membrane receptor protein involved in Fe transport
MKLYSTLGRWTLSFWIVSVASALLLPRAVHAETSDSSEELSLGDILNLKVTVASLFEESPLQAGASVSSISSSQWTKAGAVRTLEALERVPGVMVYHQSAYDLLAIRGFSSTYSVRGFALSIDGIPINTFSYSTALYSASNFDLGVLDHIEMIRGPGSTIYGSDAFHGVVAMKTWTPSKNEVIGNAAYGSFSTYKANLKASYELIPNVRLTLGGALTGIGNQNVNFDYTKGIITARVPGPANIPATLIESRELDARTVYAKVSYGKAELGYYFNNSHTEGEAQSNAVFSQYYDEGSSRATRFQMVKLTDSFSLPWNVDLDAKAYYLNTHFTNFFVGIQSQQVDLTSDFSDTRSGVSLVAKRARDKDFPVQMLLGYQFDWMSVDEAIQSLRLGAFGGDFGPGGQTAIQANGTERRIHGMLAQTDTALFNDQFHVLVGARYDVYGEVPNHMSPRLGLIYLPTETSAIKLLYGNAYRAPAAGEMYGSGTGSSANPAIKPETIDTYELIYMATGHRYSSTLGLFYSSWQDAIRNVALSRTLGQYQNTIKSQSYGAEAEEKYYLLSGNLDFVGSGSYVRSSDLLTDGFRADYTAFPLFILNYGIEYRLPPQGLEFSLFNRHQIGQTNGTDLPGQSGTINAPISDFFRTDLYAGWDFGRMLSARPGNYQLGMTIRNLFNNRIYSSSVYEYANGHPEPGISALFELHARI